jgi:glycosyltransferase involved in cell wall biosynthesis
MSSEALASLRTIASLDGRVGILAPSVGFVSTYPPTRCGIATFTQALRDALAVPSSVVVALVDEPATCRSSEVVAELVRGSPASLLASVAALESSEVVVVQHEFGIYGGEDGGDVLDLVARLRAPIIIILHTVLRSPSPRQRAIIEELSSSADRLVVLSATARTRLLELYDVRSERVAVVPHGAPPNPSPSVVFNPSRRPIILTWGLLGPGKGIEFAIDALAELRDLDPAPRYVVHGQTHPRVAAREGESYRDSLRARARSLGVADLVEFDDGYVDTESVLESIREADVVLLPYESRDQVVSGVLVEAIASGKPVVATQFPHAVELLSAGSGILVPHDDASSIARALRAFLTDPHRAYLAASVALRQAEPLMWENVGRRYRQLMASVARTPAGAER